MLRRLPMILTLLVMLAAFPLMAQETPPEVIIALDDLNARTGLALTLDDPNLDEWAWREEIFNDGSLGCPQPDMMYTQAVTRGYVITFRVNEFVYDYRAAAGSGSAVFCNVASDMQATDEPGIGGQWEFEMVAGSFNPVLDWSPSGETIAVSGVIESSGEASGAVLLYDPLDLQAAPVSVELAQPVTALQYFSADPMVFLVTGGGAGDIGIFPVEPRGLDILLMDAEAAGDQADSTVNDVAINAQRTLVASVNAVENDPALQTLWAISLWDANTGELVTTLQPESPVTSLAFNADGDVLAAGGGDGTVMLFDTETGDVIAILGADVAAQSLPEPVTAVEYSPNGDLLAVASGNTATVWDVADAGGEISALQTLSATDPIRTIDFSPDGTLLAAAGGDPSGVIDAANTILIWDVASGEPVITLPGHTDAVGSIAFSPDGSRLASVSYDGTLRVWELGVAVG
ncbi:MAG: WD40 repeat domain-containing protein [Anaerolinea sp.]|nr:WD40 repeat domain-containing protein [Anaerolinea sp.]